MKRIILMLTVAAVMAVAMVVAAPTAAFATNTCKDTTFPSGPPYGQQTCEQGSSTTIQHGKSGNQDCVKHTGHGDVPC